MNLFRRVRSVEVIEYHRAYGVTVPDAPAGRGRDPIPRERLGRCPQAHAPRDVLEDAQHRGHGLPVDEIAIPRSVIGETVRRRVGGDYLPLPRLPQPAPTSPLRRLGTLELGELVEDAVREFTFWGVVSPIV